MSKIYIVSERYGCEMEEPIAFKNKTDAEDYIKNEIFNFVYDDYMDEMEEENIDIDDINAVLEWGEANDYCTSYHDLGFPDTYTADDDWSEFMLTEIDDSELY